MISDLKKVWAIFTPAERRKSVWMLVLVVLMALAETISVLSIMPFLSVLGRPEIVHESTFLQLIYEAGGFTNTRSFIFALGVGSILSVVGSSAFKTLTLHALNRFVHFLRSSISVRLLSRYVQQPYEFFLTHNPSILGKNVLAEVDQLLYGLIQPVSQLIAQGAVVLAVALLIFVFDPNTALGIVLALGLLYGTIYIFFRKYLTRIGSESLVANSGRYQICTEALSGIKDLKITQAANSYQATFNRASREFSRNQANIETLTQSPLYLVEATGFGLLVVLALLLLGRNNDIAHILPALGMYGFAAYRMLPSAQIMYRGFARLQFSSAALETVHQHLTLPKEAPASDVERLIPQREIRLSGIRYAYPSTPDKPILDGFDLVIAANTSTGIAGPSGAGKSTVMDLLLGLLKPQKGTVSVDGVPIDSTNVHSWQRAIGYVPQFIFLADASVAENIAFGIERNDIDMLAVKRAAEAAQIHEFIMEDLADGYDTAIGDRGIRLSGGQRQRLGVARALYNDPAVILLDEATSALDRETEEVLGEAVRAISTDKTVIVIAHKEASLLHCNRVVRIAENSPTTPQ